MSDLSGKKLLILGANPETIPLVQLANDLGVKTLVTSNRTEDPAKAYAWKACEVDGLDVPGLIALAREEKVDGVLVGVADILVPAYCKVCDALGFYCYASQTTMMCNYLKKCEFIFFLALIHFYIWNQW